MKSREEKKWERTSERERERKTWHRCTLFASSLSIFVSTEREGEQRIDDRTNEQTREGRGERERERKTARFCSRRRRERIITSFSWALSRREAALDEEDDEDDDDGDEGDIVAEMNVLQTHSFRLFSLDWLEIFSRPVSQVDRVFCSLFNRVMVRRLSLLRAAKRERVHGRFPPRLSPFFSFGKEFVSAKRSCYVNRDIHITVLLCWHETNIHHVIRTQEREEEKVIEQVRSFFIVTFSWWESNRTSLPFQWDDGRRSSWRSRSVNSLWNVEMIFF